MSIWLSSKEPAEKEELTHHIIPQRYDDKLRILRALLDIARYNRDLEHPLSAAIHLPTGTKARR